MRSLLSSRRLTLAPTQISRLSRTFSVNKFLVPDRGYLELSGKDLTKFLQGVCTNDVHKLQKHGDCIAAAFLTPKGRILADALLYYCQDDSDKVKFVVETHKSAITPLSDYLSNYKLRSKVKISNLANYRTVLDNSNSSEAVISTEKFKSDETGDRAVLRVRDPRIFSLGIRSLYYDGITPVISSSIDGDGRDDTSSRNSINEYNRLRLLNGLTEGPEIVNRIPLECNLDLMNYIDFSKGCYVGQELTARTKFKGLVRKRILPFLRSTLHPQFATEAVSFCPVDNKIIQSKSSSLLGPKNEDSASEIGTICLPKMEDDVDGFDLHIGDIISSSINGDICCALVRLENVLPRTVGEILPEFGVKMTDKGNDIESDNADDASLVDTIMIPAVPIRPPYWVEKDPITHHRIDTHAD